MLSGSTGWKVFDFFGAFFNFNGVLPGNEMFFFFWHFSLTYNVRLTKIICISMPDRLNVFFSHFS